jgi:hypothetical protein
MDEDRQQSPLVPPPANSPPAIRQLKILLFYIGAMLLLAICLELIKGFEISVALALFLFLAFFALTVFGWLFIQ